MGDGMEEVLESAARLLAGSGDPADRLGRLCKLVGSELEAYDWVGFYLVDPSESKTLFLGPYEGAPTDHTRIAFGTGICGQAAETKETFVIDDVTQESNYLACSLAVKSEIVAPVFHEGRLVGELDIDSHQAGRFTDEHRALVERLAEMAAPLCAAVADAGPVC